jgi:hypothetical protein
VPDNRWQELAAVECHKLLAERHLGRLALTDPDEPVIFPVNYVLDEGAVVFRTDPGSKLDAIAGGARVAFEVDAVDEGSRTRLERGRPGPGGRGLRAGRPGPPPRAAAVPVGAGCQGPLRAHPAGVGHRPAHRHAGQPAVHLVGLTSLSRAVPPQP